MQSTTMNSVFLECYLAHNLGDDLFLETLLRRYPDVHFTCVVDGSYDWLLERYHNISLVRPPRKKSALGVFLCFCQLLGELTCRDSGWLSWARFALPVASGVLSRVARFRLRGLVPGRGFRF